MDFDDEPLSHALICCGFPLPMLLLIGLLLKGCVTPAPKPDDPPPVDADCVDACDWLRDHGCEAGEDTEEGVPCEVVCEDAEDLVPGSFTGSVSEQGCGEP